MEALLKEWDFLSPPPLFHTGEDEGRGCRMKLTSADQVKTITLSDGTVATIRKPRGRDLVRAQDVAGSENKFKVHLRDAGAGNPTQRASPA
jgi:hypothetical protein